MSMRRLRSSPRKRSSAAILAGAAGLLIGPGAVSAQERGAVASSNGGVVEVTATDFAFRAPDEIPAGWTTIRFTNEGEEHHFLFMSRLPEGKTIEHYETELSAVFNRVWLALRDDGLDQAAGLAMLGESLPEWFPSLQFIGGPGFVAPGLSSVVTLNLPPGNYVLECYMKTADGEFHYMEGMLRPLVVRGGRSAKRAPSPEIRITLSNYEMSVEGDLTPGKRTIAVHVAENPEAGFGHSVHLARLDPAADRAEIVEWMNAFNISGMRPPAPATFIGGLHAMPVGETGYFTVELEPGRYLLISEATAAQGVLHEFTVEE